jgi:hypothetical protein
MTVDLLDVERGENWGADVSVEASAGDLIGGSISKPMPFVGSGSNSQVVREENSIMEVMCLLTVHSEYDKGEFKYNVTCNTHSVPPHGVKIEITTKEPPVSVSELNKAERK